MKRSNAKMKEVLMNIYTFTTKLPDRLTLTELMSLLIIYLIETKNGVKPGILTDYFKTGFSINKSDINRTWRARRTLRYKQYICTTDKGYYCTTSKGRELARSQLDNLANLFIGIDWMKTKGKC